MVKNTVPASVKNRGSNTGLHQQVNISQLISSAAHNNDERTNGRLTAQDLQVALTQHMKQDKHSYGVSDQQTGKSQRRSSQRMQIADQSTLQSNHSTRQCRGDPSQENLHGSRGDLRASSSALGKKSQRNYENHKENTAPSYQSNLLIS